MKNIKSQIDNPHGLHRRYHIQKVVVEKNPLFSATAKVSQVINNHDPYIEVFKPIDEEAEYFVLRLDYGGKDENHITACRMAIMAYANAIRPYIPKLAQELLEKYPLK